PNELGAAWVLRRQPCQPVRGREERAGLEAGREAGLAPRAAGEVLPPQERRVALWAEGPPTFSTSAPARGVPKTGRGELRPRVFPAVDFLPAAPQELRAAPPPAVAAYPRPGRRSCNWW